MIKSLNASALGVAGSQSEVIEQALTHRFDAIDLDVVGYVRRVKLHGAAFARRLIESSKLQLSAFALPFSLELDDAAFEEKMAALTDWASAAAELGCTRCLTAVEPAGDRLPYHENFNAHRDRFAKICQTLEPHGIRLGVGFRGTAEARKDKTFQFIHELDALLMLINMVNAPNIGVDLDVWEVYASGGTLESIRGLKADQIVSVELADAPADVALDELTEASRVLPNASGQFDIPAVVAALAEMGYDGPVAIKPDRSIFPSTRGDEVARAIRESLDEVWQAAGLTPQDAAAPADASI